MADLHIELAGILSANPFWLASGPATNSGEQVSRAFDAGWGGAVWKTLGDPIVNVTSRLGALDRGSARMLGLENLELITDRPLADNLRELAEVKRRFPKTPVIASLMAESKSDWQLLIRKTEDTGCDALELNFGCPHGMCERGMGSTVGQEPRLVRELTSWAKEFARIPVLVKLSPNVGDITDAGQAAVAGGADAIALINTLKSVIGVDLDRWIPLPRVGQRSSHGGYSGPGVKPVALQMLAALARDSKVGVPLSGIGGIGDWRDAAEFIALGASSVQICTAVMLRGYRIIDDLVEGLGNYLEDHGLAGVADLRGRAVPGFVSWGDLDLSAKVVAKIDPATCIGCQLCVTACQDGAHQCIFTGSEDRVRPPQAHEPGMARAPKPPVLGAIAADRVPWIDEPECVGCNLCQLVCPVPGCITMEEVLSGPPETWNDRLREGRDKLREGFGGRRGLGSVDPACAAGGLAAARTPAGPPAPPGQPVPLGLTASSLPIYPLHHSSRVASSGGGIRWKDLVELFEVVLVQPNHQRPEIVLQMLAALGSRNRNHVVSTREDPGQGELGRAAALFVGLGFDPLHELEVPLEVLTLEARMKQPLVDGFKLLGAGNLAGEKAAPERAESHEAHAQLAAGSEHRALRVAAPERVFGLQRSDRMDRMCPPQGGRRDLREAQVTNLALRHQLRHGPDRVLDGNLEVDSVQIIKVDDVDLKSPQARLAGLLNVARAGVEAASGGAGRVLGKSEFGGQHESVALAREEARQQLLVLAVPVLVGGVVEVDAGREGRFQGREGLGIVGGAVVVGHAHASQTELRDLEPLLAKSTKLHVRPASRRSIRSRQSISGDPSMHHILLTGNDLRLDALSSVARREAEVALAPETLARLRAARALVEKLADADAPTYGINTGFGDLAEIRIDRADLRKLQRNLIVSHSAGVGSPLPAEETRGLMLLRANVLAKGYSGARLEVVETLLSALSRDLLPMVPERC